MSGVLDRARETLSLEAQGIQDLRERLNSDFERAVEILFACKGKVIITGMGKSGLISQKIAATLTSTGTPSLFLHAADSFHGDLGIITSNDSVIAISFSGETEEVVQILGHIHAIGVPVIGMSGNPQSSLAKSSTIHLDISVEKEACPLELSPTTSSTVTLALGDALAMCLLEKRNFRAEDFAMFHPGGSLGKKLTILVKDIMITGNHLPVVREETLMKDALRELSEKNLGVVIATDTNGKLAGIFSVGDLMRLVEQRDEFINEPISNFMTRNPKVVRENVLAAKALYTMETYSITVLVVVDDQHCPTGLVQIYHILRAGVY